MNKPAVVMFSARPSSLLLVASFALSALPAAGQAATEAEVLAPIHQLFDGMRAGDSTAVRTAFAPIARLVRTGDREGVPHYGITEVADFAARVGEPHEEVWDEKIWDVKVEIRDNLASAWMNFAFFAGDRFSHCGVNSAELVKTTDGWKIMHLADTAQREGCELPPELE